MKKVFLSVLSVLLFAVFAYAEGPYAPGRPSSAAPPDAAGEYRIKDKDGKTKYIGETNDLKRRKKEHERSGKIEEGEKFLWKKAKPSATTEERRAHEKKKIEQHQPYGNKSKGGEGRKANKAKDSKKLDLKSE